MIEDKEGEFKIAENSDEAFWKTCQKRCQAEIENSKREVIINERILILCEEMLKEF